MQTKMEEIGRAVGGSLIWRAPVSTAGAPGAHRLRAPADDDQRFRLIATSHSN
jgi:hypothetical protein